VPEGGHLAATAAAAEGHSTHETLTWRLSQDNSRSSVVPTHDKFGIRVALLLSVEWNADEFWREYRGKFVLEF
jgi:hypothetical protein